MSLRAITLLSLLLLAGCAAPPRAAVTVSQPRVYGDDQVLRFLGRRLRELDGLPQEPLAEAPQVSFDVRRDARTHKRLRVNLLEPPGSSLPARVRHRPSWYRRLHRDRPEVEQHEADRFQRRLELGRLRGAYELLYQGDQTLLGARARAVLLQFEVTFTKYLALQDERRFSLVRFVVEPKRKRAKPIRVYLLSPEYRSVLARESWLDAVVRESAAELLGTAGGVGLTGGFGSTERMRRRFVSLLETPLQFAVYHGARKRGAEFTFAFGPRRRLQERSIFSPARWFGSPYQLTYEIQPGPRRCQALLVFDRAARTNLEFTVRVYHDDALIAQEDLDLGAVLRGKRPRQVFQVSCPPSAPKRARRHEVLTDATSDLLLSSNEVGFSQQSTVLLGPVALPRRAVQVLGRGRLLVRVTPRSALRALFARGRRVVSGRVLTPDQPTFSFRVRLLPSSKKENAK